MMNYSPLSSRKRLSDITNTNSHDKENVLVDRSTNNYVQKLIRENAMMMKLVQEKDKTIESYGLELQTLRVNLQRTQHQNWLLAQSNSQMLADHNLSKDRLKALQHELACMETMYKVKVLDLKDKKKMQLKENHTEIKPEKAAVDQPKLASNNNENKVSQTKRARPTRSQSLGPPKSQQAIDTEMAENKRRCLRRQSVILKPQEAHADLFEINIRTPSSESLKEPPVSSISERVDDKEPLSPSSKHSLPEKVAVTQPKLARDKSENNENKLSKTKRPYPTRSQSLGPPRSQQAVDTEMAENKRRCLRRQSIVLNPQEAQCDLFEININTLFTESVKLPLSRSSKHSSPQRSSIGRPVRRATEKIQSYKDPSLNTKLRRP